jgi:hypothetical protein
LVNAIVEALRSAGATEEIIAAAVKAGGEFCYSPAPGAAAARATMPMVRRASALIDGVTKFPRGGLASTWSEGLDEKGLAVIG